MEKYLNIIIKIYFNYFHSSKLLPWLSALHPRVSINYKSSSQDISQEQTHEERRQKWKKKLHCEIIQWHEDRADFQHCWLCQTSKWHFMNDDDKVSRVKIMF